MTDVPFSSAGGYGAWEPALRCSHLDLDLHSGPAGTAATVDAVRGGVQIGRDLDIYGLRTQYSF